MPSNSVASSYPTAQDHFDIKWASQQCCIEIMFGRMKDWRRVAPRYDRCPTAFFSAIVLAATVIFWL